MSVFQIELTAEQKKAKRSRKWVREYMAAYRNATSPMNCEKAHGHVKWSLSHKKRAS